MNILIKFSGEFFDQKDDMSQEGHDFLNHFKPGQNCYVVIGGGNRVRGRDSKHQQPASDNIGIISTLMNGFVLKENLLARGFKAKLFSHFIGFGDLYAHRDAIEAHKNGNWVIFASGLGKVGYISTDVNSVIKALEVGAHGVIKITKSGGVYDRDPKLGEANLLPHVTHQEAIEKKLAVMDIAAMAIAADNNLPIAVITSHDFEKFMNGQKVGSVIGKDWRK